MKNTKNTKNMALNGGKNENCFFKAFFWGLISSIVLVSLLCLAAAAFLGMAEDSTGFLHIASLAVTVTALFASGIVCAKIAGQKGVGAAFMCGCAFLGISYALSSLLKLGGDMNELQKTLCVAVSLLGPVVGAKAASRRAKKDGFKRKNVKL